MHLCSIEARHEYGGFFSAQKNLASHADRYHIWVNVICMFGAVFVYNTAAVVKAYLGEGGLMKILRMPIPKKQKN